MRKMPLKRDLRKVGAGEHEADSLADVAELLGSIKMRGLSSEAKKRLAPSPKAAKRPMLNFRLSPAWRMSLGGGFATACVLLIAAQSALPGSFLYPVKRKAEDARSIVQPGYDDQLLEKREEEVEQLKKLETVAPEVVQEAEKTYQQTAEDVQSRWQKQGAPEQKKTYTPKYDWSRQLWQSIYQKVPTDSTKSSTPQDSVQNSVNNILR